MRLFGVLLLLVGAAACVRATRGALADKRPRDLGWALVLPAGVALFVLGALLLFVPGFLR